MNYIGILLDDLVYRGIPYGKTGYENITFYEEAGKIYGLTPCFFRLKDIKVEMDEVAAYVRNHYDKYKKIEIPIPRVIHNRGLYFSKKHKEYLGSLVERGIVLFNQWNRYRKIDVYHKLIEHADIIENLPETRMATQENLMLMINKYSSLIIKPNSGSLGNGLMKIEENNNKNILIIPKLKEKNLSKISFKKDIPTVLKQRIASGNYIVQECILLTTYKGNPFDIRVSCQKNHLGEWQVTGIVGKVARDESFITNVARGGTAYSISELLRDTVFDEKKIMDRIKHLSLKIATILEMQYSGLADIGLDLGITAEGVPKFIECNGRDLRYSFRNANMYDTWKNTYTAPIGYGKFLIDRR